MILEENKEYVIFNNLYRDGDLDKRGKEKNILKSSVYILNSNDIYLYDLLHWSLEYNDFKNSIEIRTRIWC